MLVLNLLRYFQGYMFLDLVIVDNGFQVQIGHIINIHWTCVSRLVQSVCYPLLNFGVLLYYLIIV